MNGVVVLEWNFSPPDYFESKIEIKQGDYTMIIADGKVEAKIDSVVYETNPLMRDALHDALESRFLSFQLSFRKRYNLSNPTKTRVEHTDGRKDYVLEVEPGHIKTTFHPVTLSKCDKDGNVVADHQTERMKNLNYLVNNHYKDETLRSLLKSHNSSIKDPNNELLYLYEIRDALYHKFGGERAVISALKTINHTDWSWFGNLCNEEPLRQGRHRGKKYNEPRDATEDELSKARAIAQAMIEGYVQYLDTTTT
jgi:hypothetical protein